MFKKVLAKLAQSKFADGKLAYGGLVAVVAPAVSQVLGIDIAPDVILDAIQAIGVLVTTVGYVRRALKAKQAAAV